MRQGVFTPKLKLLWHRDRIDQWLTSGTCVPVMIEFDLTNRCNLRCNFCTFEYIKDRSDIDTDAALRAIDDFAEMGVKAINFTGGGEPTLHKDFLKIVQHAKARGLSIGLFTNGLALNEELCIALPKCCDWIRVSIDCASEDMFKKTKTVYGLSRVRYNTSLLVKHKGSCAIGTGFVITRTNYKEIPAFSLFSRGLSVDYAQYKPEIMNCFHDRDTETEWWITEVKPLLDEVMNDNDKAVINLYKFDDILACADREYDICYGHNFVPCVGATGDVWVCTHLRNIEGFTFGNIVTERFKDIWSSEKRKEVIGRIDLSKCQLYCRNNEINKVLWALKTNDKKGHYNFI
jgi:MoaA/NifB/PqqE/SkfB family radical SAM enzyme